jgi:hypothetical protein
MNSPNLPISAHRYHRLQAPPRLVLSGLCGATPLYVHARNWMAEMAAISPLTENLIDEESQWISFPEQGLNLSLAAIRHLHSVEIDHPSRPSLALEIATHGDPRAVSFAAIPSFSDMASFAGNLSEYTRQYLTGEEYDTWRSSHIIQPSACLCCAEAAARRRKNPEKSPLVRIFSSAIAQACELHCRLQSESFRFAHSFVPGNLLMDGSHIGVTGRECLSILEIDPGLCHSLVMHRREIDAEPMTSLRIYNSLGVAELTIETTGWGAYDEWLEFCKPG